MARERKERVSITKAVALTEYLALGDARDLVKLEAILVEKHGRSATPAEATLKRWAREGRWKGEAEKHDAAVAERLQAQLVEHAAKAKFDAVVAMENAVNDAISMATSLLKPTPDETTAQKIEREKAAASAIKTAEAAVRLTAKLREARGMPAGLGAADLSNPGRSGLLRDMPPAVMAQRLLEARAAGEARRAAKLQPA